MPIYDQNKIIFPPLPDMPDTKEDLSKDFYLAFDESWQNGLSYSSFGPVTRNGPGRTVWTAHHHGFPDFGDAPFADPGQFKGPEGQSWGAYIRTTDRGEKVLRMRLGIPVGQATLWGSHLQSYDKWGNGYGAKYGYFEICARFPDGGYQTGGNGVWPSWWLVTRGDSTQPFEGIPLGKIEIDIFEYYGVTNIDQDVTPGFPTRASQESTMTLHKWLPDPHVIIYGSRQYYPVNPCADYHTYGCLVTPGYIIYYYDRQEFLRIPTPPEHRDTPYDLGLLVSMAQGGRVYGWPTPAPVYYDIKYIRVWEPNPVETRIATIMP